MQPLHAHQELEKLDTQLSRDRLLYFHQKNLSASSTSLPPTVWKVHPKDSGAKFVATYHLALATTPSDLVNFLHEELADEVERGNTYSQEVKSVAHYTRDAFEEYFFAADVFLGLRVGHGDLSRFGVDVSGAREDVGLEVANGVALDTVRGVQSGKIV